MPRLYSPEQAAELLVGRRKALGLSQAEVAARLGISQNRLSELETRPERLTFDRLLALAGIPQRGDEFDQFACFRRCDHLSGGLKPQHATIFMGETEQ